MDMSAYLAEMQHAVTELVALVWAEHSAAERALARLQELERETKRGYDRVQALVLDEFDDDGTATATYWDTYFGPDKERFHAASAVEEVETTLAARDFSRCALASSLLQYGKQGISIVHGDLASAPAARQLHGVELKQLIWQGRNQAQHWEDGKPHKAVIACFDKLKAVDVVFTDYSQRSLAFEVIRLLQWNDWTAFERDMLSLA